MAKSPEQTTIREALIEAINTRGLQEALEFNPEELALHSDTISKINNEVVGNTGWKNTMANALKTYLFQWNNITVPGSNQSVLDLPVSEFSKQKGFPILKHVATVMGENPDQFAGRSFLETAFDQAIERVTDVRPFKPLFADRNGKKLKKKYKLGTPRERPVYNIPNDLPFQLRRIEEAIGKSTNDPLKKITAQFMNFSGHRAEETSRLKIDNFIRRFDTEQGSNYKLKDFNLHAGGWKLKQGFREAVHFTPLTKTLIYNALEIAKEQGKGPEDLLFPNAAEVDTMIADGLKSHYGVGNIVANVADEDFVKEGTLSRAFLRRLSKERILSSSEVFDSKLYDHIRDVVQGITPQSTEFNYMMINRREAQVNILGKFMDDQIIAYGGHGTVDKFIKSNNLKDIPGLAKHFNEVPKSENIVGGAYHLDFLPDKVQKFILDEKRIPPIDATGVDFKQVSKDIKETGKGKAKINRLSLAQTYMDKYNKLVQTAMDSGLSEENARSKADDMLNTMFESASDKKRNKEIKELQNFTNKKLDRYGKNIVDNKKIDFTGDREKAAKDFIKGLFDPDNDYFQKFMSEVDDVRTFVTDTSQQVMDLMPDKQSNLGKIAGAAGAAVVEGLGGRFIKPIKKAGKIAKGAGKLLLPSSTTEGKVDLALTATEENLERFKQTPEYKAEQRRKAAFKAIDNEAKFQKDELLPEEDRTVGDRNPTSNVDKQLGELGF